MITIQGIVHNGQVHTSEPLHFNGQARCLITIFDENLEELRRFSQAKIDDAKQARLSLLLQINKESKLSEEQERDLDAILTEVHQLAAKRARAVRLLEQLHFA